MPHSTERAEIIEDRENQIVASVISDAINLMNTIVDSSDSTESGSSIEMTMIFPIRSSSISV